uniref:Uncharacterized protein n=1 Tax=Anguilla anguilla TaxID=7936 RepID=A0A0E9VYH6_ANGAN
MFKNLSHTMTQSPSQ